MLSPDGRWMLFSTLEPDVENVFLQPFSGGGERIPVSPGGGREPVFSPAGNEIFYRSLDQRRMMAVDVTTNNGVQLGLPRDLFEGRFRGGTFWSGYDVTSDGARFLMVEDVSPPQQRLHVKVHWANSIERQR